MFRSILFISIMVLAIITATSCKKDKYDINNYYPQNLQDTLMTNIIINIYKVPKGVRKEDKHLVEYRHLYVKEIPKFKFVHYFIDQDSTHYFYLIRPARNIHNHKRGVVGKYKVDSNLNLLDFEEILNTPMLAEEEIIEKGKYLWADLMYYKHVNRYSLNKHYIEFPDERTRYDKVKKEWTYEKEMFDINSKEE